MIHAAAYAPGDRLPSEGAFARNLGVSRLAVREAMVALATAAIVAVRTGDGTFVRRRPRRGAKLPWAPRGDPRPGTFDQFRARRVLEPEFAAAAAGAATLAQIEELARLGRDIAAAVEAELPLDGLHIDFHAQLAEASGIALLAPLIPDLLDSRHHEMWRTLRSGAEVREYRVAGARFRHELVAALRRRDADEARGLMRRHLESVGTLYFGGRGARGAGRAGAARDGTCRRRPRHAQNDRGNGTHPASWAKQAGREGLLHHLPDHRCRLSGRAGRPSLRGWAVSGLDRGARPQRPGAGGAASQRAGLHGRPLADAGGDLRDRRVAVGAGVPGVGDQGFPSAISINVSDGCMMMVLRHFAWGKAEGLGKDERSALGAGEHDGLPASGSVLGWRSARRMPGALFRKRRR
jgi:DNA-binding FadR family transcriptional regulator